MHFKATGSEGKLRRRILALAMVIVMGLGTLRISLPYAFAAEEAPLQVEAELNKENATPETDGSGDFVIVTNSLSDAEKQPIDTTITAIAGSEIEKPTSPAIAATEPAIETTEPAIDTTEPGIVTTEPAIVPTESGIVTTEPAIVPTEPGIVTTEPAIVPTEPGIVTTEPAIVPTEPAIVTTEPAIIPTEPAIVPTEPGIVTTEPAIVPTEPAIVTTEPAIVPTEPGIVTTEPAIVPTEPAIVTTEPAIEPTAPAIEPTKPAIEPTLPALKARELVFDSYTAVYDAKPHGLERTSAGSLLEGDNISVILSSGDYKERRDFKTAEEFAGFGFTESGAHRIVYIVSNPEYETVRGAAVVTISQRPLVISAPDQSKVYDGTALSAVYKISESTSAGGLLDGHKIEGITTGGSITDVGTAAAIVSGASIMDKRGTDLTGYYDISFVNGILEITPAEVTVKADDQIKIYGEADPTLTAIAEGSLDGDSIVYSISREEGEEAGSYAITLSGEALQGNYSVTYITGASLTIKTAEQIVSEAGLVLEARLEIEADVEITLDEESLEAVRKEILNSLSSDELISIMNGETDGIDICISVKNAADNTTEMALVDKALKDELAKNPGFILGPSCDITMSVSLSPKDGVNAEAGGTSISALKESALTLCFTIPESIQGSGRTFRMIVAHLMDENTVTTASIEDKDSDENTVTIDADRFSIYSFIYRLPEVSSGDDDDEYYDDDDDAYSPVLPAEPGEEDEVTDPEEPASGSAIEEPSEEGADGEDGEEIDDDDTPLAGPGDGEIVETTEDEDMDQPQYHAPGVVIGGGPGGNQPDIIEASNDPAPGRPGNNNPGVISVIDPNPVVIALEPILPSIPFIEEGTWALSNLVLSIGSTISAIFATVFRRKEDYKSAAISAAEQNAIKSFNIKNLLAWMGAVAAAIISIVTFLETEDMTLKVAIADKWTLILAAMLACGIILAYVSSREMKKKDRK